MAFDDYPDTAAELDADPDEFTLSAPTLEPFQDEPFIYRAVCLGGPWDGATAESRYPKGFLLIHMPSRKLWIYELSADAATFRVRGTEPLDLLDTGDDNRWRAADEADYDIRVMDPETVIPTTVCEAM